MNENMIAEFQRLYDIVRELRVKCPWDREQTMESIRHLTIEETYELSDAILKGDMAEMKTELGDLFMHMLFYTSLAEDAGAFTTEEMIHGICEKLIRRHPHIYGDVVAETSEKVLSNWEEIKLKEGGGKKKKRVLGGVPQGLPALIKAMRMQEKARNVGFDWDDKSQVWAKVEEEMGEFHEEAKALEEGGERGSQERAEKEFGDLLFSLVNYARFVGINPEDALERANLKFKGRFEYLEDEADRKGRSLRDMTLEEMDAIWEESKASHP